MQFTRLRLKGFKSFVDPTDLLIEPGMTGIVGPNGCGKSNLVEALRWVMGETSAKRMRGGEMDDVIFAGSQRRPSHNLAEVALHLDNSDRTAPPQFNNLDELDVVRRIERDKGSQYRINGREVRARDVQLLFADQATGAQSTAMVSQGRVGAIIAAKPSERRLLLEEAAGITGLHSRRHEAELRLRAAEANLERLDDVVTTLSGQLSTLQKQARQAQRYRRVAEQIRRLEAIVLHLDHAAAEQALDQARMRYGEAEALVQRFTRLAAEKSRAQANAATALPGLREKEAAAAAELQRLKIEMASLEQEERQVAQARKQAEDRLAQTEGDRERAAAQASDGEQARERLEAERTELLKAGEEDSKRRDGLEQAREEAAKAAQEAERRLSELSQTLAADEARFKALERREAELAQRLARLQRRAEEIEAERERLSRNSEAGPETLEAAGETVTLAEAALDTARGTAEAAEKEVARLREAEASTREVRQQAEAALSRLETEIGTLARILERASSGDWPPAIDAIRTRPGVEKALGAALGDDLDASLEAEAPLRWSDLGPLPGDYPLPPGVEPLSGLVKGPEALARRLSQIGLVPDHAAGAALQADLKPGQRLVSREGDLWRWDGFVAAGDAPSAAAQRLEQQNRLAELRGELPAIEAEAGRARAAAEEAQQQTRAAVEAERGARQAVSAAYNKLDQARREQARLAEKAAALASRLAALSESETTLGEEIAEVRAEQEQTTLDRAELPDLEAERNQIGQARALLAERRAALAERQSALDNLLREASARGRRLDAIAGEIESWRKRGEAAAKHLAELDDRQTAAREELARLAAEPRRLEAAKETLAERIAASETRRQAAADALAQAETRLAEADRASREEDGHLAEARETRVRAEGAVEQAGASLSAVLARIAERIDCPPEALLDEAGIEPEEDLPERGAAEKDLQRLVKEREAIGPVNLRAETEAEELETRIEEMQRERSDLTAAIGRLRQAIASLNREGRERLMAAFEEVNTHFQELFVRLFGGGRAHLTMTESEDPLQAGLEIMASPPGKRLQIMSLLSGGEQALTALSLLFGVFLTHPAPICVLDEVDAPLDDANVDRFCSLVDELAKAARTRFLVITHHRMTMSRMDRLFGVTMSERGVSKLVSVDLAQAEELRESA